MTEEKPGRREPGVPQLMQELQLNVLQQTHLMQAGEKVKSSLILQQLQSKQQQLMAQIQLAQHALTLNMLLQSRESKERGEKERDRHRSETQYSSDGSTKENQNNNNTPALPSLPSLPSPALPAKMNGNRHSSTEDSGGQADTEGGSVSLLYSGGLCRWPGCDRECPSQTSWRSHMSLEHGLSDKTTAQARVQMQMVTQLEVQLKMEKARLAAMMKHLHPGQSLTDTELQSPQPKRFRPESPAGLSALNSLPKMTVPELLKNSGPLSSLPQYSNPLAHLMSLAPASQSMSPLAALTSPSPQPTSPTSNSLRYRVETSHWSISSETLSSHWLRSC